MSGARIHVVTNKAGGLDNRLFCLKLPPPVGRLAPGGSFAPVSAMPPGLGPRLRWLLRKVHEDFDANASEHPDVRDALAKLDQVVEEEFPLAPPRKRRPGAPACRGGRPVHLDSASKKMLKGKLKWARHRMMKAEAALREVQHGKDTSRQNRLTPAFLAKVALSWPSTSARAFANAWRDLVGVGATGCSRTTISKVKDAFAEVPRKRKSAPA